MTKCEKSCQQCGALQSEVKWECWSGDFCKQKLIHEPDPDILREDRDERRRLEREDRT